MHVRLSPTHGQNFRRCFRDAKGQITGDLVFTLGQVYDLSPDECELVKHDIGKALQAIVFNEHNSPVPVTVTLEEINAAIAEARRPKPLPPPEPESVAVAEPAPDLSPSGVVTEPAPPPTPETPIPQEPVKEPEPVKLPEPRKSEQQQHQHGRRR